MINPFSKKEPKESFDEFFLQIRLKEKIKSDFIIIQIKRATKLSALTHDQPVNMLIWVRRCI